MIVTEYICEICYEDEDIVSAEEICDKCDVGVNNPLLVCRYCFDTNIYILCSGGCTKQNQKKDKENRTNMTQLQESVQI